MSILKFLLIVVVGQLNRLKNLSLSIFFMTAMMLYPAFMDYINIEFTESLRIPHLAMIYLMGYYLLKCI